jgi:hypothetical protein
MDIGISLGRLMHGIIDAGDATEEECTDNHGGRYEFHQKSLHEKTGHDFSQPFIVYQKNRRQVRRGAAPDRTSNPRLPLIALQVFPSVFSASWLLAVAFYGPPRRWLAALIKQ